jgi:hypothetical protein
MKKIICIVFIFSNIIFACNKNATQSISTEDNTAQNIHEEIQINEETNIKNIKDNEPMNIIESTELFLPKIDEKDIIIQIKDDYGHITFDYGVNTIGVTYFSRQKTFDGILMYDYSYDPDFFIRLDREIGDNHITFSEWYFNMNMRKRKNNNIVCVDSFCFSSYEFSDRKLARSIFISTLNYNIEISIVLSSRKKNLEIYDLIISEAPEYFIVDPNANQGLNIMWNTADSIEKFGVDLINGSNRSTTATEWYLETERLLSQIYFNFIFCIFIFECP